MSWCLFVAFGCTRHEDPFEIAEGFEIRLVVSEPQVVDPIAIAFDENERMYVVEMVGYPEGTNPPQSSIKILEDKNGDGRFETSHVFLGGLQYPTSVLPWNGGVLVASTPDLLFCKDTNGDSVADVRKVLLTGFDVGNTQHNFNSLTWGLDNWVYGAGGGNAGNVTSTFRKGPPVSIRRRDFRFRPDSGEFETTVSSSGGYGIAFNAWGQMFGTHNMLHIQHAVMPERYLARNPALGASSTMEEISDHGRVSQLFPISVPETRHNHPEQAGVFSGSSGITFYGGGAFGEGFGESIFVGDVVTNVAHRDVLVQKGATFVASRAEKRSEFLASRDNWFRPVNFSTGPEGALYVIDMHRAVIEHPEWIPDAVEKNLNVRAGDDRGRIYRIVPRSGMKADRLRLGAASTRELVGSLEHPNMWRRQTAQRLLIERKETEATTLLAGAFEKSQSPLGRLHALWTLEGLGALADKQILDALGDSAAGVRENAVRLAEARASGSPAIAERLRKMSRDPDARVRFQVALALGQIRDGSKESLFEIAARDVEDRWTRLAVASSVDDEDVAFMERFLSGPTTPGRLAMVQLLGSTVAARRDAAGLVSSLRSLGASGRDEALVVAGLQGLAEGLGRSAGGGNLGAGARSLMASILERASIRVLRAAWPVADKVGVKNTAAQKKALAVASAAVLDPALPEAKRLDQIQLLEFSDYRSHGKVVLDLVHPSQPSSLQVAAIDVVGRWSDAGAVAELVGRWRQLSPAARKGLITLVLRKPEFHVLLVEALEREAIRFGELALDLEQRRRLLRHSSADVMARAARLFGDEEYSNRRQVVSQYLDVLKMAGDAQSGEAVFRDNCAKCHALAERGGRAGPDLSHIYTKSTETLLTEVLDPNAVVEDRYISYTIKKKNGTLATGLIKEEIASAITLSGGENEEETINRSDIAEMTSTGISLMPEGLERTLDRKKLADLIAFLQQRPVRK